MIRRIEYRIIRNILPILLCMISVYVCTWGIIRLSVHEDYCIHGLMDKKLEVSAVNVPKDTCHLEILVPKTMLKRNGHYVDRDLEKWTDDGLSRSAYEELMRKKANDFYCRLSGYEQDGYVSAIQHYDRSIHGVFWATKDGDRLKDFIWMEFTRSERWDFERIRDYKIAYVDKKGNVLGVTEQAAVQTTLDPVVDFRLTADGSTASCTVYNPTAHIALTALKVAAVHVLLIFLVWYLRRAFRRSKHPQPVPADNAEP